MKILFTPVGTMDPVANYYDGPMIHIARKIKPDIIYIYLSKELGKLTEEDDYSIGEANGLNRYEYSLRKLEEIIKSEDENYSLEIRYIYGGNEQVYEYNEMLEVLREHLLEIQKNHSSDKIYLNTSSGTPAMKYALYILYSVDNTGKIAGYQVSSPKQGINNRDEKVEDYLGFESWELNYDNQLDYVDRAIMLSIENLHYHFKKEALISHLLNYQYVAAYEIGRTIDNFISDGSIELLKYAADRNRLRPIKGINLKKYGIIQLSSINEYILSLGAKLHNYQDMDFIRGITPVYEEILRLMLRDRFNFKIEDYVNPKTDRWDTLKLKKGNFEVFKVLDDSFRDFSGYVSSAHSIIIYSFLAGNKDEYIKHINYIRDFEIEVRNLVAHTLVDFGREKVEEKTEYKLKEVLKKLKLLANSINKNKSDWKDYDRLNDIIIKELNKGKED